MYYTGEGIWLSLEWCAYLTWSIISVVLRLLIFSMCWVCQCNKPTSKQPNVASTQYTEQPVPNGRWEEDIEDSITPALAGVTYCLLCEWIKREGDSEKEERDKSTIMEGRKTMEVRSVCVKEHTYPWRVNLVHGNNRKSYLQISQHFESNQHLLLYTTIMVDVLGHSQWVKELDCAPYSK